VGLNSEVLCARTRWDSGCFATLAFFLVALPFWAQKQRIWAGGCSRISELNALFSS
jgi:hypothetical protein